MVDQFDVNAENRDATLSAARREASGIESEQQKREIADLQSSIEEHVLQAKKQEAEHEINHMAIESEDAQQINELLEESRAVTAARQLELANEQVLLDKALSNVIRDSRLNHSEKINQNDTRFENSKNDHVQIQLKADEASFKNYTKVVDAQHINTANQQEERITRQKSDQTKRKITHAQNNQVRETTYVENQENNLLDHIQKLLNEKEYLESHAYQREKNFSDANARAHSAVELAKTDIAIDHAYDLKLESARMELSHAVIQQRDLTDKVSIEKKLESNDQGRLLSRAQQAEKNDRNLDGQHIEISQWKIDAQTNEVVTSDQKTERYTDFLGDVKARVNLTEKLRAESSQEQAQRANTHIKSKEALVNAHIDVQVSNDDAYRSYIDSAFEQFFETSNERTASIANLEQNYRLRRAEQETKQYQSNHPHYPDFETLKNEFHNNLDETYLVHNAATVESQNKIANREHQHELYRAVENEQDDFDAISSQRNEKYAVAQQSREVNQSLSRDEHAYKTDIYALDKNKKIDSLSAQAVLSAALHDKKVDHINMKQASQIAISRQTQFSDDKFEQTSREKNTSLQHSEDIVSDNTITAKKASQTEVSHAKKMLDINLKHESKKIKIHDDHEKRLSQLDGSKKSNAQSVLKHREATRRNDHLNQKNFAQQQNELAAEQDSTTTRLSYNHAQQQQLLQQWVIQDQIKHHLGQHGLHSDRHAKRAQADIKNKNEEALAQEKDIILEQASTNTINQAYAHDASSNEQYEINVIDVSALTLENMHLNGQRSKAADHHNRLLAKSMATDNHQKNAMSWEAKRLDTKHSTTQRDEKSEESSKNAWLLAESTESIGQYRLKEFEHIKTQNNYVDSQQKIDEDFSEKTNTIHHQTNQNLRDYTLVADHEQDHLVLDEVDNTVSLARKIAQHSDRDVLDEMLPDENAIKKYDHRLSAIKSTLTSQKQLLDNRHAHFRDALFMNRIERSDALRNNRIHRRDRYNDAAKQIKYNQEKFVKLKSGAGPLVRLYNNGGHWLTQLGVSLEDRLDTFKETFDDMAYTGSLLISGVYQQIKSAENQTRYYVQRVNLLLEYSADAASRAVNASVKSVSNTLGVSVTRFKNWFKEGLSSSFSRFILTGQYTALKTNQVVSSVEPTLSASFNRSKVSVQYHQENLQQNITHPLRLAITKSKAAFRLQLNRVVHIARAMANRSTAWVKLLVNHVWSGAIRMRNVVSDTLNGVLHSASNAWRSFTHDAARARRKARQTVILPSKQAIAQADKNRKTGLAYFLSKPVIAWRAFKHLLRDLSWQLSVATYPTREALTDLNASVSRNTQYYTADAKNEVLYQSRSLLGTIIYAMRKMFNSIVNLFNRTGVQVVHGVHKLQENTPNPETVVNTIQQSVNTAHAQVTRASALAVNDMTQTLETSAEAVSYAVSKSTQPVRSTARSAATSMRHRKKQTTDSAHTTVETLSRVGTAAASKADHAATSAVDSLQSSAQSFVNGVEQIAHQTAYAAKQYALLPLQGFLILTGNGFLTVIYAADYHVESFSHALGATFDALLSIPGQMIDSAGLSIANAIDHYSPTFSTGWETSVLTVKYYGQVMFDGTVYAVEILAEILQSPVTYLADTAESTADTLITGSKINGLRFAILYDRSALILGNQAAAIAHGWIKVTDQVSYGMNDSIDSGVVHIREGLESFVNVIQHSAITASFNTHRLAIGTSDMLNDAQQTVAFYGNVVTVNAAGTVLNAAVNLNHAASSVHNTVVSGLRQVEQTVEYYADSTQRVGRHVSRRVHEVNEHFSTFMSNTLFYALAGSVEEVILSGKMAYHSAKYCLTAVHIPLAESTVFISEVSHEMNSSVNRCGFQIGKQGEIMVETIEDAARSLAKQTVDAFEGYGDAAVLAMKGAQVSVNSATGNVAVKGIVAVQKLDHQISKVKTDAAHALVENMHEGVSTLKSAALETAAAVREKSNTVFTPVLIKASEASTVLKKQINQAKYVTVKTVNQWNHHAQVGKLLLTSKSTQLFTKGKHSVEGAGRDVLAQAGQTKDEIMKVVDDSLNIQTLLENQENGKKSLTVV